MSRRIKLLIVTGVVTVLAAVIVWQFAAQRGVAAPPPLEDGMASFIVHDPPRPLPELSFSDGQGNDLTLDDFRGRLVLMNVWATWCPPCLRELPSLDRLQGTLGGDDFEVVALSIDREGVSAIETFYTEAGIENLEIYSDRPAAALSDLALVGLPTTLLVAEDGRVLGRYDGPAEWDEPEVLALIGHYLDR